MHIPATISDGVVITSQLICDSLLHLILVSVLSPLLVPADKVWVFQEASFKDTY